MKKNRLRQLDEARHEAEIRGDWEAINRIDTERDALLDAEYPRHSDQERVDAMHEAAKEAFAIPEDSPV